MAFNFGSLASTEAVSNKQPMLEPWGIYDVKFAGATKDTVQGVKDPSQTYQILRIKFENADGYYEQSLFYPKDGDDKRPTYTAADGHEYQGASSFERTMSFIAQVASVLNPEGYKKMQAASSKFKSFDNVADAFIKIMTPVIGKETKLKVCGRNVDGRVLPTIGKFLGVNKKGELFVSDNFIGNRVFFSSYETKRMNEYKNAKPTPVYNPFDNAMAPKPMTATPQQKVEESSDDDLDFDNLL